MKRILAFVPLLLLVFCSARAAETNEIGRYQLFTGPMDIKDDEGVVRTGTALYRIDTVTGQTWRYDRQLIRGLKKPSGVFAEGWVIMVEDPITSLYLGTSMVHGSEKANATFPHLSSTNAYRQASERMYSPPKHRDEYDAIIAEAVIRQYIATNHSSELRHPSETKNEKK